jgi:hypothetical protein
MKGKKQRYLRSRHVNSTPDLRVIMETVILLLTDVIQRFGPRESTVGHETTNLLGLRQNVNHFERT